MGLSYFVIIMEEGYIHKNVHSSLMCSVIKDASFCEYA